jgi:hypothetical protein
MDESFGYDMDNHGKEKISAPNISYGHLHQNVTL